VTSSGKGRFGICNHFADERCIYVARRSWTFSPRLMWGGELRTPLEKTLRAGASEKAIRKRERSPQDRDEAKEVAV